VASPEPPAVTRRTLQSTVRRVLRQPEAHLLDWGAQHIPSAMKPDTHVFRFRGHARAREGLMPWSVVLKIVSSAGQEPPREVTLYRSGFLAHLPGRIAAPQCLGIDHPSRDEYWLWMEDVRDETDDPWPLARYALAARHLGQFGAASTRDADLPRGWLGRWIAAAEPALRALPGSLATPLVARAYPCRVADEILALWARRDLFLNTLDRLSQTTCHFDAHRHNLRSRRGRDGQPETIVLDWEYAGCGALGIDAAPMVGACLTEGAAEPSLAHEMERSVFSAYLAGLDDLAWSGDPARVRLAYVVTLALRYTLGATRFLLPALLDDRRTAHLQAMLEQSVADIADRFAVLFPFFLSLAKEADRLIASAARQRDGRP